MAKIDWGADQWRDGLDKPGRYLVEVAGCQDKISAGNDPQPMWVLRLTAPVNGNLHVGFDNVMLGGRGAGLGVKKLRAFGITEADGEDVQPEVLIGRRAWAEVYEDEYQGRKSMKVNVNAKGSLGGYWPADQPPEGAAAATTEDPKKEGTPF